MKIRNKPYVDGNCEECALRDCCPAPILNWCSEVLGDGTNCD